MKSSKRPPKNLNENEVNEILKLTPDTITKESVINLIANFDGEQSKYEPQDRFVLKKDIVNKYAEENIINEDIHTTLGRYLVNCFLFFNNSIILKKVGYVNEVIDKKKVVAITNEITQLVLEDKVTVSEMYDYLNRLNWFGFTLSSFVSPSINTDILITPPSVEKKKKELISVNEEELKKGNPVVATDIESELISAAKESLKDNPAKALYDSGSKINFSNQYKEMNLMGGPTINNETGEFRIVTNSLIDGLDKDDIAAQGDSIVTGVYSRAVNTQKSGYEGKKILAAMQNVVLDRRNSDCNSTDYFKIFLTKENKKYFLYRYIKKGNSLVCLEPDVIDNYIGSFIQLRSPLYCKGKKICNKCAGDIFYLIGVENVGLMANKLSSISLNLSLKKFHDQSLHTSKFDYKNFFN